MIELTVAFWMLVQRVEGFEARPVVPAPAANAGYEAAVTTRKGLIFSGHRDHLTALPRLSLAGEFQKLRYVDVLLSGSAFALWNGFRQLNVA